MANKWGKSVNSGDFILLGSKNTEVSDKSHTIKRCLLFGRKAVRNLDSILNSRHITLPTKICIVKAMFFIVVIYGCESWTINKAECKELKLSNCDAGEDS